MGSLNTARRRRAAPEQSPPRQQPGHHGHLWQLPDGTGIHAPFGRLVRSADGQLVCCHLCGRWFEHLGAHVRVHGYNAASYKEAFGLLKTKGMIGADLSAAIATRQREAYTSRPEVRERFRPGQVLARSGQLAWLARRAEVTSQERQEAGERLAAIRADRAARRDALLAELIARHGSSSLHAYLREQYAAGASLDALVRATGLSRAALRTEVVNAGVVVRRTGVNTAIGKRSRALTADETAAERVGTANIRGWLAAQRDDGVRLHQLAEAVGRSIPWVRSRLAGQNACGGRAAGERSWITRESDGVGGHSGRRVG